VSFYFLSRSDLGNSKRSDLLHKFVHAIFYLSGKKQLGFSDVRKFGKITLLDTKIAHEKHLGNLGPEPLEKQFTITNFKITNIEKAKPKDKNRFTGSNDFGGNWKHLFG